MIKVYNEKQIKIDQLQMENDQLKEEVVLLKGDLTDAKNRTTQLESVAVLTKYKIKLAKQSLREASKLVENWGDWR